MLMAGGMKAFFDWQLKRIFFEEVWSFRSINTPSAIKERIENEFSLRSPPRSSSPFKVTVDLNGDHISVYSRRIAARFLNAYYFSGTIKESPGGSVIYGEYRSRIWTRVLLLYGLNLFLLGFIIVVVTLISTIVKLPDILNFPESASIVLGSLFFFAAFVGTAAIIYVFARGMAFFEKISRNVIRSFLEWVAKGDASPQSN